jgi:hypothetical protein
MEKIKLKSKPATLKSILHKYNLANNFFVGYFNDALRIRNYVVSNAGMIGELMK